MTVTTLVNLTPMEITHHLVDVVVMRRKAYSRNIRVPKCLRGVGLFPGEYHIDLKQSWVVTVTFQNIAACKLLFFAEPDN